MQYRGPPERRFTKSQSQNHFNQDDGIENQQCFAKFIRTKVFFIFLIYTGKTSSYATRNVDCIPLIKIKNNFFKNTFFPATIIEWNKLDPAIRNAEILDIFKTNILKFIKPTPRQFFNCYNHKGIRLMSRLRLGLIHPRKHKFNHNFQNCINPFCNCGMDIESTSHFFLHCPLFDDKRITLTKLIAN